jgi:hypothetical protein
LCQWPFIRFLSTKNNGNIEVPRKDPYTQLHHWIVHAKTEAKKSINEGERNPQFTMPHLESLNKLGLIKLPTQFKLEDTPTTPNATKKKKAKAPPKAKATIAPHVSVAPPKNKKSVAAQTKGKCTHCS